MGHVTDTVGTGRDYADFATWWANVYNDTDVHSAEAYGPDELGPLNMAGHNPNWTATATEPCEIYAASGHEQDGSLDETQGAYSDLGVGESIAYTMGYGGIRGLRLNHAGGTAMGQAAIGIANVPGGPPSPSRVVVERNLVVFSGADESAGVAVTLTTDSDREVIVKNNLLWTADPPQAGPTGGIYIGLMPMGEAHCDDNTIRLYANSIRCAGIGAPFDFAGVSVVLNANCDGNEIIRRNNVAAASFLGGSPIKQFRLSDGGTNTTVDFDYDVSDDDSADDDGGTNHITAATESDIWADPAGPQGPTDADAPFNPKRGGAIDDGGTGYGPNGENLFGQGVIADAVGNPRPDAAQHRGGIRLVGGYCIYAGPSRGNIDYASPIAQTSAGTSQMDLTGLSLLPNVPMWLGIRVVSVAGVEETNTDRVAVAVVDEQGQLQGPLLAPPVELTARRQSDGSVVVGFSYYVTPGYAAATGFEIFSDGGSGELDLETPVATVAVTDSFQTDFEAVLPAEVLPAIYAARAVCGEQDGPLTPPVTVSAAPAPTAARVL